MNINIKTTLMKITPEISEYIEKRFSSFERFFKDDTSTKCDIEIAKTTNHHKNGDIFRAEVHIVAKDKNIYASAEKEDCFIAIDMVKDEVLREIKTLKDKKQSIIRKSNVEIKKIIKGID